MIIENSEIKGLSSDLTHLDQATTKLGFVRWQWEYYRATYDLKFTEQGTDYFLRINCRVTVGKLEQPDAELVIEEAYIGKATFPHGLDYQSVVPDQILQAAKQKCADLKKLLSA